MAKKCREEEPPHHSSSWKIALADLMTVLMVFFLVMWLSSTMNPEQRQVLAEKIIEGGSGVLNNGEGPEKSAQLIEKPFDPQAKPKPEAPIPLTQAAIASATKTLDAKVEEVEDKFIITLKSDSTFESGRASIPEATREGLEMLAEAVAGFAKPVVITGHTDNVPISTLTFPTNWELSAGRAASVARIFEYMDVAPQLMTIQGRASAEPVAKNTTSYGRSLNRRIVITIEKNPPHVQADIQLPSRAER